MKTPPRHSSILSRIQGSLLFGGGHAGHAGRPSTLFNEDDYDYAIELLPDDEYRQAAEALPDIVDFDEVELVADESLVDYHLRPEDQDDDDDDEEEEDKDVAWQQNQQQQQQQLQYDIEEAGCELMDNTPDCMNDGVQADSALEDMEDGKLPRDSLACPHKKQRGSRLPTTTTTGAAPGRKSSMCSTTMDRSSLSPQKEYDTSITAMGTGPLTASRKLSHGVITKREFSMRLNLLKSHKTWVEKAARRSSIGFQRQFPSSDKETMDKFLVLMTQGIHVRRHQSNKVAEMVRLFSTTGCQFICWEKPKPIDLLQQRQREGVQVNGSTSAVFAAKYDRNIFDFFIASKSPCLSIYILVKKNLPVHVS